MTLDPAVFKAYDVRGLYPGEVDEDGAERIGRAFIAVTGSQRVALGHDARVSSPSMATAFRDGVLAAGADVVDLGEIATEMLYFAVGSGNASGVDAGAVVTASHNPPQYTGVKLVVEGALPLSGDTGIGEVGRIAEADSAPRAAAPGRLSSDPTILERFVDACMAFIDPAAVRGLRVVLDATNGMAGLYLPSVLERLDIEPIPYFLELDGRFPNHGPNPLLEENRRFITSKVLEHGADLGIAWDGDADRCFFIDGNGEFVPGDFLTALLARHLLEKSGPAPVIYDLRASWCVRDTILAAGGTPDEYRVGHAFIKRRMREIDAIFAGEVSGHYYFKEFSYADTGLVPALLVLELLSRAGRPLAELVGGYRERYHISGEINSTVPDAAGRMEALAERFADGRQGRLDGLSVAYDDWHFNVRPSNTEPLLRLNLESLESEADMERRRDEVLAIIRE
ncbi:MAG TPA: phosphomannomutase/phosphoglucomutase [Miltoncostaeaceae bacterium]|nr:phosphomannomutase/phosphoglucomutase [Miltoncostaeaceae bacterium]